MLAKELVFISHATPEDNDFTLWLSSRLKLAGYQVWSDVTQLFGGEKWWQDIDEAIADYTCKFILIITRASLSKPGVQKELEYALAAEKKNQLPNFIIPIIIDDSPFYPQPYNLSDRNIISFKNNWAQGLARLSERMRRDLVPANTPAGDIGAILRSLTKPPIALEFKEETVTSNLLAIESYPGNLNFFRVPVNADQLKGRFADFEYPWFEFSGMIASFATLEDIKQKFSQWETVAGMPSMDVAAMLTNKPRNHVNFQQGEVIKKINYIVAESWSATLMRKGLHRYSLSSGKQAFFFPAESEYMGMVKFPDIHGQVRKRQIVGLSQKNSVYWHFAVEAKILFGRNPKISLIPHVVFSEDGKNPLADKNKMIRLRRGFCKMWWNDRWRDMLLAYLYVLSGGDLVINLAVGSVSAIGLASRPNFFISPVSLVGQEFIDESVEQDIAIDTEHDEKDLVDGNL
jgi:hypothetical protein